MALAAKLNVAKMNYFKKEESSDSNVVIDDNEDREDFRCVVGWLVLTSRELRINCTKSPV